MRRICKMGLFAALLVCLLFPFGADAQTGDGGEVLLSSPSAYTSRPWTNYGDEHFLFFVEKGSKTDLD